MLPRAAVDQGQSARDRLPRAARQRVIVERIQPEIDDGRFAIKRTPGETVVVRVDVFADGHDLLAGVLKHRVVRRLGSAHDQPAETAWTDTPLEPLDNDAWSGSFVVEHVGRYEYTVEAWIDRFGSWLKALIAKAEAGQDVASELLEGAELIQVAAGQGLPASPGGPDKVRPAEDLQLLEIADLLRSDRPQLERVAAAR